jgi:hypothetical protein
MVLIEEALHGWRQAERLLANLPPVHPDHESVALALSTLKAAYQDMTERADAAHASWRANEETIRRSLELLERVRAKLDAG